MQIEQFWSLIEQSKGGASDCEEQAQNLTSLLEALEPDEITGFDQQMRMRLVETYRWDLWAVAYIICGGCSDDSFEYFRCWLVSQGREFYEAVLVSPERAAERVEAGEEPECELLLYAAWYAFENKMGKEIPPATESAYPSEPLGEPWTDEDLERLYPDLCRKYWVVEVAD